MITFKEKQFSSEDQTLKQIVDKFEKEREYNYEVSEEISPDYITITTDLNKIIIYLPSDYEDLQYSIDDYIRGMLPYAFVNTESERKLIKLTIKSKLTFNQYYKLVKFLISEGEFCVILN